MVAQLLFLFAHDLIQKPGPIPDRVEDRLFGVMRQLFPRFGPLRHVLDAYATERQRKRALGLDQSRPHHVVGQRLGRNRPAADMERNFERSGNCKNALTGNQRYVWICTRSNYLNYLKVLCYGSIA